jgi:hypothetical protein
VMHDYYSSLKKKCGLWINDHIHITFVHMFIYIKKYAILKLLDGCW